MHRLPVGGNIIGGVFALGVVVMFLVGIPLARWFLLASLFLGAAVSIVIIRFHKRHAVEITDLSDLENYDQSPKDE